jgi:hypothetical protein
MSTTGKISIEECDECHEQIEFIERDEESEFTQAGMGLGSRVISLQIALKQLRSCVYYHDQEHGRGRSYLESFLTVFDDIFHEIEETTGSGFSEKSKGRWLKNQLRGEAARMWHEKKGKCGLEYHEVRQRLRTVFGGVGVKMFEGLKSFE